MHIPFCRSKCGYCSFVSFSGRDSDIDGYVGTLCREITRRSKGEKLSSIFFGGGTPGLLGLSQVESILQTVASNNSISLNAEISFETNPGISRYEYLSGLRGLGVNRLSIGVQSFNDDELSLLERIHTAEAARDGIAAARRAGFDNLNIDLIYGIPGQTLETWQCTLAEVVKLKPEHVSLYALTLEPECPLAYRIETGHLSALDGDLAADMYELAEDILDDAGYRHYEISNWAKPGFECRHNLVYWRNLPYLGVGVAAHSSLDGRRTANTSDPDAYLTAWYNGTMAETELDECISPELKLSESLILGLRLVNGVDIAALSVEFAMDIRELYRQPITEMMEAGLLEQDGNTLRLTRRGRLLSNEVFWRLLPEEVPAGI